MDQLLQKTFSDPPQPHCPPVRPQLLGHPMCTPSRPFPHELFLTVYQFLDIDLKLRGGSCAILCAVLSRVQLFAITVTHQAVHGILQTRILERMAIPFSTGSSWPRESDSSLLCLLHCRQILYRWATGDACPPTSMKAEALPCLTEWNLIISPKSYLLPAHVFNNEKHDSSKSYFIIQNYFWLFQ